MEEKVQLLMHQKIFIFSSAYSCASFLPQKPLPLFAEKVVIPHNRCQLAIEHEMREQSYVNRDFTQRRRRRRRQRERQKSNTFRQAKQQDFARAKRFFVHFSAVVARLQRENA